MNRAKNRVEGRWRRAATAAILFLPATAVAAPQEKPRTISVRQDGTGDFNGNHERVLQEALNSLRPDGGVVEFGPGRYVLHATVFVPPRITLRGTPGAVFALPSPVLVAEPAAKGATELVLESTRDFASRTLVQILPPSGDEFFADGETRDLRWSPVMNVEGDRLILAEPLALDVPKGSRVGYSNKLFKTTAEGRVVFEHMSFDGGRVASIPMPGHHLRTAIWSSAPFQYGEVPTHAPSREVVVKSCIFRNLYGRGVAYYHTVDSLVEASVFEGIADEAIDFDHFCYRNRAIGNEIRDAWWGVVLNDASDCVVEYNNIDGCKIGIWAWWYKEIPREGLNRNNVVRHNVVRNPSEAAIHFDRFCSANTIERNFVQGEVVVLEGDNQVSGNSEL